MELLKFIDEQDLAGSFFWRTEGDDTPCTFYVLANDLLWWAAADGEKVTPENFDILKKSIADCEKIDPVCGGIEGCSLFACRVRQMRPQGAIYPSNREYWKLYDECGPERKIDFLNPYKPGEYNHVR